MNRVHGAPFEDTSLVLHPSVDATPGEADLVGFVPGPAGTCRVVVHPDVIVEVDFAEPERLCSIVADDVGGSRNLESVIGSEAYRGVRSLLLEGGDRPQQVSPTRNLPRRMLLNATSAPGGDDDARSFAFALAARAVGDDPYEAPLVRAVAYVEGAALLLETPWDDSLDHAGLEEQLEFATETLLQDVRGDRLLAELDLRQYELLVQAVSRVASDSRWAKRAWAWDLRQGFPSRLFHLDERRRTMRDVSVPRMMSSAGPADMDAYVERRPPAFDPVVERVGRGRFVYRFVNRPDGSWLRLLDVKSQSLMALVPIVNVGREWEAHVVLPVRSVRRSVVHEVTDSPIVPATSSIDLMIAAVDHGRAAARLSAAGDPAASDRWRLCARVWEQLGDTTRAARALAYAGGGETVTRPRFLHDAVDRLLS